MPDTSSTTSSSSSPKTHFWDFFDQPHSILTTVEPGASSMSSPLVHDTNTLPANFSATDAHISPNISSHDSPNSRPVRIRRQPSYLQDYYCNTTVAAHTALSSSNSYPPSDCHHQTASSSLDSISEPTTYKDAVKHECWNKAIAEELKALTDNNTWFLTSLPPGNKAIGNKWIFKVKYRADGTVERHKARLVAKGYNQTEGLDYMETFSPVAQMTTIRVLLTLAAANNWYLHQLDVNTAFLHGDLEEEVYMTVPLGMKNSENSDLVCHLKKSIYGLKQASRQWNQKLTSVLSSHGFVQSRADYSLFVKKYESDFTAILIYVDDLLITGNSLSDIQNIKTILNDTFTIKDLGDARFFLGMELTRFTHGIFLFQKKYALELLQDTGLTTAKPVSCPLDPAVKLQKLGSDLFHDPTAYRRLIGRLVYLTNTRPDISFSVGLLSQFMDKLMIEHQQTADIFTKTLHPGPFSTLLTKLNLKSFYG